MRLVSDERRGREDFHAALARGVRSALRVLRAYDRLPGGLSLRQVAGLS
jgi:hypothetical protein